MQVLRIKTKKGNKKTDEPNQRPSNHSMMQGQS